MNTKKTFNPYIGICKFIMSLFVVAIHVEPFTNDIAFYHNNCLARIADPMFFLLSAYFLFDKLIKHNWDRYIFFKQIIHLFKYYLLWVIIFSPIIISRTLARTTTPINFVIDILKQIFLSGPYGALWFLPALMLGLILTYIIGKKTTPFICLIISFPFLLFSILEVQYHTFVKDIEWMNNIYDFFISIFGWLGNGINFAFFFCALGLYIAFTQNRKRNFSLDCIKLIVSFILLIIECAIIRKFELGLSYCVMFFLIPVSYYLTQGLINLSTHSSSFIVSIARYLQDMSLLVFPLHFVIMESLASILKNNAMYSSSTTLQYIVVTLITCSISTIIIFLSNNKRFQFLKFLYGKSKGTN